MARPIVVPLAVALAVATIGCSTTNGTITRITSAPTTTSRTTTSIDGRTHDSGNQPGAGAADVGDTLTPGAGNGGYDVSSYALDITVGDDPATITAETTTIEATATEDLTSFHLDLSSLDVADVTVDGRPAQVVHDQEELVVTPAKRIKDGAAFTTVVHASGTPSPADDPSAPGTIGWLSAPSGSFVASEPTGAKTFFPSNDHPSDKAMFTIKVTAPSTKTVVANGRLTSKEPAGPTATTWTFGQSDPMATYLVQVAIGDYDIVESVGPHDLPIRHAVVRTVPPEKRTALDATADQIAFFEPLFGPFPFDTYGVLVADANPDFALETQTLTLLPASWLDDDPGSTSGVLAHELSHQWFGDAVSVNRWSDIWLNEGFATYAEWLWNDHIGASTLAAQAAEAHAQAAQWRIGFGAVATPTAELMFSPNEYGGAAIVLQALRDTVGDEAFFTILRRWVADNAGKSAGTADFEHLAGEVSGKDLTTFFDQWLRSTTLPPFPK